jgi:hypothetical protein
LIEGWISASQACRIAATSGRWPSQRTLTCFGRRASSRWNSSWNSCPLGSADDPRHRAAREILGQERERLQQVGLCLALSIEPMQASANCALSRSARKSSGTSRGSCSACQSTGSCTRQSLSAVHEEPQRDQARTGDGDHDVGQGTHQRLIERHAEQPVVELLVVQLVRMPDDRQTQMGSRETSFDRIDRVDVHLVDLGRLELGAQARHAAPRSRSRCCANGSVATSRARRRTA